jgi:hypothetical protein
MQSKIELPNQRPGEKIMLTLRRHWFVLFLIVARFVLFAVIPVLIFIFLYFEEPEILEGDISTPLLILSCSLYYLFIWMFLFNNFIDYYLDVWVVTTERIINIEQKNLFSRTISEKNLDRMQDITSEVKGILKTFLNYGTIYIQTAGTTERFIFKDVPNAPQVTQQILKIVEDYRRRYGLTSYQEQGGEQPPSDQNIPRRQQ